MIKPEYKYSELTGRIIGCSMEVHNELGNGFQEVIYQRAWSTKWNYKRLVLHENLKCLCFTN